MTDKLYFNTVYDVVEGPTADHLLEEIEKRVRKELEDNPDYAHNRILVTCSTGCLSIMVLWSSEIEQVPEWLLSQNNFQTFINKAVEEVMIYDNN